MERSPLYEFCTQASRVQGFERPMEKTVLQQSLCTEVSLRWLEVLAGTPGSERLKVGFIPVFEGHAMLPHLSPLLGHFL